MTRAVVRARSALVIAAVLCLVLPGCSSLREDEAVAAEPSPTATVAASPAPSASGVPQAESPVVDVVPVAAPTHLAFPAAGIDGAVEEYTAADAEAEGGINPATLDTISWYSGVPDPMPGTAAKNTVYLFGHTWIEPAAFNGLGDAKPGDQAIVTTANGELVYEVDEVITMAKSDFTQDPRVAAVVPGRLALVTCHRPPGLDDAAHAPDNTVVLLHLVAATAAG